MPKSYWRSLLLALLVLATLLAWAGRAPAFVLRGITITGDTAHTNVLTLRANVAPRLMHELCMAALAKDVAGAMAIQMKLLALHSNLNRVLVREM